MGCAGKWGRKSHKLFSIFESLISIKLLLKYNKYIVTLIKVHGRERKKKGFQ